MIQANELRMGNLISHPHHENCIVSKIYRDSISVIIHDNVYTFSNRLLSPIPLTEEILIKFGFQQSKGKYGPSFHIMEDNGFVVMFTVEHWTDTEENSKWKNHWHVFGLLKGNKMKYVHQLQNLFFVLTGEELQYNP